MNRTRSSFERGFLGETYREEPVFVSKSKLQTGKFVIGRMLSLCKVGCGIFKEKAARIVAAELRQDWIDKNVYPAHESLEVNSSRL